MRILLTGGTGFIGKNLVEELSKSNFYVKALVRGSTSQQNLNFLKERGVELVYGDLTKKNSLQSVADDVDVVIHLGGRLGSERTAERLWQVHVMGTKNLLDVCSGQKFIYCSSAGILGPIVNGNEDAIPNPTNTYERAKLEAEKLVKKYPNHVILRPEFLYGPHDKHVLGLFKAIKKRQFFVLGDGKTLLHPTYIQDFVNVLMSIIKRHIKNETFMVGGQRAIRVIDFYKIVAENIGAGVNKLKVPKMLGKAYVTFAAPVIEKIGLDPLLTKGRFLFFTCSRTINSDKAKKWLGYQPYKLKDGLRSTISWYRKRGFL